MRKQVFPLASFAGLDVDRQPLIAAVREDGRFTASTATNVSIDLHTRELVKSRGSAAWINTVTATGEVPLGVMEYKYQSGQRKYIVRTAAGFYVLNAALDTYTSMSSTLTGLPGNTLPGNQAMLIPSWAQIGRHLVVVDGQGAYYWDGESSVFQSTRRMEPPQAWQYDAANPRPKLALVSGGSLAANTTYSVWMTFYSSGTGHSPPLPCGSIRTDSSNKTIRLSTGYGSAASSPADGYSGEGTGLAAPPNGATDIYVWVSSDGDKNFYQFETLAIDNGSTNAELVIDCDTVAAVTRLDTFQGPPGGVSIVCQHEGRAFYSGSPAWPVRVWYSEPGQPFKINPSSWFDIGEFTDPVTGLISFPFGSQLLCVLKKHSVWSLSGFDDSSFLTGLQREADSIGCIGPHTVIRREKRIYFAGTGGIYRWTPGEGIADITAGVRSYYLDAIRGA